MLIRHMVRSRNWPPNWMWPSSRASSSQTMNDRTAELGKCDDLCAAAEAFWTRSARSGACEVPVVAVAEGGVRETVQDGINGLLVHANPTALADAITHILEDPRPAQRLGTGGHAKVKSFWSTEAATSRLIEAFEDTLVAHLSNS